MIRAEYLRFLQTLQGPGTTDPVRKIANLVLSHLDKLIPLSTYNGQRVKEVVSLAQKNWGSTGTEMPPLPEGHKEQAIQLSRLKKLSVGPFRGFAKLEEFDLGRPRVLIYGPNGTGKSRLRTH